MKTILKSIGAFLAAVFVTATLSYGTDAILVATNLMPKDGLPESATVVAFIVAYRTVYNVLGAFVLAKLAPSYPVRHAAVLAVFGILGSLGAMSALGSTRHAWYAWVLTLLILPSIWLGTFLATRKK